MELNNWQIVIPLSINRGWGYSVTREVVLCLRLQFVRIRIFTRQQFLLPGNHDNNIYNIWWGETHHGIKEAKPESKKKAKTPTVEKDSIKDVIEDVKFEKPNIPTNIELAKNLKGHLLLVAGDADNNVHPANTLRMVDALIKAGKNFDMLILPGQNHGYWGASLDFFRRKIWFHFAKYLLGDYSTDQFTEIDEYMRLGNK